MEIQGKDKIIRILKALFPEAKIILYGSRARGEARNVSDIDIAVDAGKKLSHYDIMEAKGMFDESNILYKLDIVDYHAIPDLLRQEIDKDGVLWSD